MHSSKILLALSDPSINEVLTRMVLEPAGYKSLTFTGWEELLKHIRRSTPDLVIVDSKFAGNKTLQLTQELLATFPLQLVIWMSDESSVESVKQIMQIGVVDLITLPLHTNEVIEIVERAGKRHKRLERYISLETRRNTQSLEKQINEMKTLARVGHSVSSTLDLDSVLSLIVEAVVELTDAEGGSLLLVDEGSSELYARAARYLGDDFVKTFRIPVDDTLAGQVIQTGQPILSNQQELQKIKTAFLVHSLMYVPLHGKDRIIGVLGVHNQSSNKSLHAEHIDVVSAIADFAAVAIENARLYTATELERNKFETIFTKVEDAVIVVDKDRRLVFMNPSARLAFELGDQSIENKPVFDLVKHPDLLQLFSLQDGSFPCHHELALNDGRTLNAQATMIPGIGLAVTMQDVTHLKELDRIKSEFVSTVSHDLRSPLTAILGYVELLDRVGPLNQTQREFVQRVHASMENITNLINELLDLGRIEAGFDTQKEMLSPETILHLVIDELKDQAEAKNQKISIRLGPNLPKIFASPTRFQQIISNLVGNAIKYTPAEGVINIRLWSETDQLVFEVADDGPGIPLADQPYIFNKFYRASNRSDEAGTGLGLAIVKTIVENHHGRVWVESIPGHGSTFTVVLPTMKK